MNRPSVAVIGMGDAAALDRCLAALVPQRADVVVTYDPAIDYGDLSRHPAVRFVRNEGQRTPLELASRAIRETVAEKVLVTKDYCVPDPGWVDAMSRALDHSAAVGGAIDVPDDVSDFEWAFSIIDLYRYASPLPDGIASSLSVYNAGYRRSALERLSVDWRHFQESAVNAALAAREGPLRWVADSRVVVRRDVAWLEAMRERFALGRTFAQKRAELATPQERWTWRLGAPAVPALMLSRILRARPRDVRRIRRIAPLLLLLLARGGGEWLGYYGR